MTEAIAPVRLSPYGGVAATDLEFTAIDVQTNGLHPGHIIELAAVRVDANGEVLGELSTLLNPGEGISPGASHVHGIDRDALDDAPRLSTVVQHVLDICDESVIVAHNLPFVARFFTREFERLGIAPAGMPGVCTLAAARGGLALPNYRLPALAEELGWTGLTDRHAPANARACAHVVARMVSERGFGLTTRPKFPSLARPAAGRLVCPRTLSPSPHEPGPLAPLTDRLHAAPREGQDAALCDAYLDLLVDTLRGKEFRADQAHELTALAADAGMSATELDDIHHEVLAGLYDLAGDSLTEAQRDVLLEASVTLTTAEPAAGTGTDGAISASGVEEPALAAEPAWPEAEPDEPEAASAASPARRGGLAVAGTWAGRGLVGVGGTMGALALAVALAGSAHIEVFVACVAGFATMALGRSLADQPRRTEPEIAGAGLAAPAVRPPVRPAAHRWVDRLQASGASLRGRFVGWRPRAGVD